MSGEREGNETPLKLDNSEVAGELETDVFAEEKHVSEIEMLLPEMSYDKAMSMVRLLTRYDCVSYGHPSWTKTLHRAAIVHAAENKRRLERERLRPRMDWPGCLLILTLLALKFVG